VRLFDPPRPLPEGTIERLTVLRGPERVETGWWEAPAGARDYHEVEDAEGRRSWAFRSEDRWYLQGAFA
jgi:protein ImuB